MLSGNYTTSPMVAHYSQQTDIFTPPYLPKRESFQFRKPLVSVMLLWNYTYRYLTSEPVERVSMIISQNATENNSQFRWIIRTWSSNEGGIAKGTSLESEYEFERRSQGRSLTTSRFRCASTKRKKSSGLSMLSWSVSGNTQVGRNLYGAPGT